MVENILTVKNLNKSYGSKTVLENVTFNLKKGAVTGFIGNNGVGKTTTIKCVLNEISFSGEIAYNQEQIKDYRQLSEIAFFPDLNNVPTEIKAIAYVKYISSINQIKKEIFNERLNALKDMLNINHDLLKKPIRKLSSGEKKMVIILGILIKSPKLIILDEPTANLDIKNRQDFLNLLLQINKFGVTIFITSHVLDELQHIIDHLVIIDNKKIVYQNTFDKEKENIEAIFSKCTNREKVIDKDKEDNLGVIYGK